MLAMGILPCFRFAEGIRLFNGGAMKLERYIAERL
jgi:hypothetical protein